jgi:hypothetical protein
MVLKWNLFSNHFIFRIQDFSFYISTVKIHPIVKGFAYNTTDFMFSSTLYII